MEMRKEELPRDFFETEIEKLQALCKEGKAWEEQQALCITQCDYEAKLSEEEEKIRQLKNALEKQEKASSVTLRDPESQLIYDPSSATKPLVKPGILYRNMLNQVPCFDDNNVPLPVFLGSRKLAKSKLSDSHKFALSILRNKLRNDARLIMDRQPYIAAELDKLLSLLTYEAIKFFDDTLSDIIKPMKDPRENLLDLEAQIARLHTILEADNQCNRDPEQIVSDIDDLLYQIYCLTRVRQKVISQRFTKLAAAMQYAKELLGYEFPGHGIEECRKRQYNVSRKTRETSRTLRDSRRIPEGNPGPRFAQSKPNPRPRN